jgi:hypothetical protein
MWCHVVDQAASWYNDAVMEEGWAHDVDIDRPSSARMYDYFLGGSHNFAVDRAAAEQVLGAMPNVRELAAVNRSFLGRVVRYLLDLGIGQFLDVGSGIPTVGNVHEIAQRADPPAKVVYVDNDPVAVAHSQNLLADDPLARAIAGDLTHPRAILDNADLRATLDFNRPIGLLLMAVLHFIPDEQAYPAVAELVAALPSGSYLAISHGAATSFRPDQADAVSTVGDVYRRSTAGDVPARGPAEVKRFFSGLELVEPGLVWVSQWTGGQPATEESDERLGVVGGVARKP